MTFPVNIQDEILMTLDSIELSDTFLIFDYTVNNYSSQRIVLFSNLFNRRDRTGFLIDPNAVYTILEPGPILSLSKQLLVMPDGQVGESPEVPFVFRLEPRWTVSETLRIPLPIEFHHPYLTMSPAQDPNLIPQFTFTLGYIFEDQPLNLREISQPDGSSHLIPEYNDTVQRQRLKRSAPVTAAVPVYFDLPEGQ